MKLVNASYIFALILICFSFNQESKVDRPYVVLISIDGFRHDYVDMYGAKNIKQIADKGVQAKSLIPVFPSKTFPNHYSIITGLYPENHGIVDSHFYDSEKEDYYISRSVDKVRDGAWYGGYPVWQLVNNNGLKSASYFWIGSEAEIHGDRPTYYKNYDSNIEGEEVMNQVVNWLKLPIEERPQFISAYFSEVDRAGHKYGADAVEVRKAVQKIDALIGKLRNEMKKIDLPINLIIVSDHGMTTINSENIINIDDLIDLENITHVKRDVYLMIFEKDSTKINAMYDTLKLKQKGRYSVYRKADVPTNLHSNKSNRVGDLVMIAKPPYVFGTEDKGTHGYEPHFEDMHGIFYAEGHGITTLREIEAFENIHIYPFIADLLDIPYDTASIDGRAEVLLPIIKK